MRWDGRRRIEGLWMFFAATAVGLLLFGYKALDHYVRGYPVPVHVPLVEELTAAYGAVLLLLLIVPWVVDHTRLERGAGRAVVVHLSAATLFSILHTTWNWTTRLGVFALLGEQYDYGRMPARFGMEAPMDVMVYACFTIALVSLRHRRLLRQQQADALKSDVKLAEARLRNLRSQLDPHFLFNALNTVSSVMYDEPERADEIIGHLSELLRVSLKSGEAREVSLQAELGLVEHYFAIIRARFGERARLSTSIPSELLDAQVPPLIIQPVVENAVRHGRLGRGEAGAIELCARRVGELLELRVSDDGPGVPQGEARGTGVGLGNLRERLSLMYGNRAQLHAGNAAGVGFVVTLLLPWRPGAGDVGT